MPNLIINEQKKSDKDSQSNVKYNYSFFASLCVAPIESQERYSEIKNHILSFDQIKNKSSWKFDRYTFNGKTIFKFWIHGKKLKFYINDTLGEELINKYKLESVINVKMHVKTPWLFIVSGPRKLIYALDIIDDVMIQNEIKKNHNENIDYVKRNITKQHLIDEKFIKVKVLPIILKH